MIRSEDIISDDHRVYNTLKYYEMNLCFKTGNKKIKDDLKRAFEINSRLYSVFRKESQRIITLFQKENIRYVLLVGIPFAERFHDDPQKRIQEDIDFLIHPEDALVAEKVMEIIGFYKWNDNQVKKHLTFINKGSKGTDLSTEGRIAVKLYRRLSDFQFGKLDYSCFENHITKFGGLCVFDDVMSLAHLIIHAHYYDFHPKILADIYMICKNGHLDWETLNLLLDGLGYRRVRLLINLIMNDLGIKAWKLPEALPSDIRFLKNIYLSGRFWGDIFVKLNEYEMTKLRCYVFNDEDYEERYHEFVKRDMCRRVSSNRESLYFS